MMKRNREQDYIKRGITRFLLPQETSLTAQLEKKIFNRKKVSC